MASVTVKVDGLAELGRRLSTLKSDMALKAARSATGAAAQVIKKTAVLKIDSNPSIETGSMRGAVIVKRLPKGESNLTSEHIVTVRGRGKTSKKTGIKQKDAPYAHYVEFGTVNMPAEPFLRPAFDQNKETAVQAMADRLKKQLEKFGA